MERICITGATGFLGGYLVKLMEEKGYEIRAFGRDERKGVSILSSQTTFFKGSLEDYRSVADAIQGCDYVIHAGALSSAWGVWEEFYTANVIGTKNVLRACKKHKIKRLVYISSPSIYTRSKDQLDLDESMVAWGSDLNDYIKSKIMAEKLLANWQEDGVEKVVIRPRGLFGVGDTSVIPRLLRVNDRVGLPIFKGGRNLMDITYVENVAHSIFLAMTTAGIDGGIYNITNGQPMAFDDLLNLFLIKIGKKPKFLKLSYKPLFVLFSIIEKLYKTLRIQREPIFTRYTLMTLGYSQTLSIKKAERELGYYPIYTIEEGIEIYAKWYRNHNK